MSKRSVESGAIGQNWPFHEWPPSGDLSRESRSGAVPHRSLRQREHRPEGARLDRLEFDSAEAALDHAKQLSSKSCRLDLVR